MSSKRPSEQAILVLLVMTAVILLAPYVGCHIATTAPSTPQRHDTKRLPARVAPNTDTEETLAEESQSPSQNQEGLDEIESLLGK